MATVTTEVAWNPFSQGYFLDPFPHLRLCRETNPVQRGNSGDWILFGYDDVKELLRSPDLSTSDLSGFFREKESLIFKNTSQCPYLARTTSHWLSHIDGAVHENARHLVERVLSRYDLKAIVSNSVRQLFAEHLVGDSIDATVAGSSLPVLVFNALYGGPWTTKEDVQRLRKVAHSLATAQDVFVPISVYRSFNEDMQWFFDTVIHDFEVNIANRPLLTYMEEENKQLDSRFSRDELTSIAAILFFGSIETTQISVSNIIHALMTDQGLLTHILAADDVSVNILSEEFFRYFASQQYTMRVSHNNIRVAGTDIPSGSRLFLCIASANRDPSVFHDPDNIVLDRTHNPHLTFGSGVHACVGSKLSRTEVRTMLKPLASALMNYKLDPEFTPEWQRTIFIRGLKELRLVRK